MNYVVNEGRKWERGVAADTGLYASWAGAATNGACGVRCLSIPINAGRLAERAPNREIYEKLWRTVACARCNRLGSNKSARAFVDRWRSLW